MAPITARWLALGHLVSNSASRFFDSGGSQRNLLELTAPGIEANERVAVHGNGQDPARRVDPKPRWCGDLERGVDYARQRIDSPDPVVSRIRHIDGASSVDRDSQRGVELCRERGPAIARESRPARSRNGRDKARRGVNTPHRLAISKARYSRASPGKVQSEPLTAV